VQPLQYAVVQTKPGPITLVFYYDVAPNTVDSFLRLASGGYYDGLSFHRIVPGFVIQGGDPKGNGTGGPGYSLEAEFNDRKHLPGVLSMARAQDPNSAGSQFFICLDYEQTKQLDNKYTAFGQVTDGMNAVKEIAAARLKDPQQGVPEMPQVIENVTVKPVTAQENPYAEMLHLKKQEPPAK
jgi:cyclophilin family peptidyl-prolyl cis-trans isomerase